jgi:hypothetical protein
MLIRIESCEECPAMSATYYAHWCKENYIPSYPEIPSWCPLRKMEVERIEVIAPAEAILRDIRENLKEPHCPTCGGSGKVDFGPGTAIMWKPCPDCQPKCERCGEPYQHVRPGKWQEMCDCQKGVKDE